MFAATLACLGLTLAGPLTSDAPSPEDRAAYREARDAAGRDPDAHVRLALWCEQHGMPAERLQHLALAVMADPAHAAARGLMGLVRDGDAWRRPEQVAERARADATRTAALAEYNARRERAGKNADDQWDLALWCEQNGLDAEARAHLAAVVRLDPARDAAWKRLGCKKVDGRWMAPEQAEAEKAERAAQEKADREWRPRLEQIRDRLRDPRKRTEAEAALAAITDPRALPSVWRVLARGSAENQRRAAQVFAQLDGPDASRALAILAVAAKSDETRRAAAEALAWRDPREFVPLLIGRVRPRIRYEVRPVGGPGSPGELFVEGPDHNLHRVYATPTPADVARPGDFLIGYDASGLPIAGRAVAYESYVQFADEIGHSPIPMRNDPLGWAGPDLTGLPDLLGSVMGPQGAQIGRQALANQRQRLSTERDMMSAASPMPVSWLEFTRPIVAAVPVGRMVAQARAAAARSEARLQADVAQLDRLNVEIDRSNDRVLPLLRTVTDQDFGDDPESWARWWTESQGYAFRSQTTQPPTVTEVIAPAFQPATPVLLGEGPVVAFRAGHSCFAAGTPVRTFDGPKPIESIRPGDRLLTRDVSTGALDYQPVVAVYHNPPDRTLRLSLDDGHAVVATPIHRFWVAGRGWAMARDLAPGDAIRTVGGLARIASVEPESVQPVFNLEVPEGHSFFVGDAGLLVHDNSLVRPVAEPFDRPAEIARAEAPTP